jgi:prepilin-type N-terminal cleavage/methylation domain-containing protein
MVNRHVLPHHEKSDGVVEMLFSRQFLRWSATAVATVFICAAIAKLLDIASFRDTLNTWTLIDEAWRDPLAWAIPLAELWLGTLFVVCRGCRWVSLGIVSLLTGFIATTAVHLINGVSPECGCLGRFSDSASFLSVPYFLLAKASLMWVIMVAHILFYAKRPGSFLSPRLPSVSISAMKGESKLSARGFTLVEVLVVVVIIGVLLSITIPAIGFARQSARMSQNLVAVRQATTAMTNYTSMNKGQFVYPHVGSRDLIRWFDPATGSEGFERYFDLSGFWAIVLARAGILGSDREEWTRGYAIVGNQALSNKPGQTFSCSLLAHSDYWNESTRLGDASQFVPPTIDIVAHPNKKIMFFNGADHQRVFGEGIISSRHPKVSPPVAFVDGSARQVPSQRIQQGMLSGDGYWPLSTHPMEFYPGLHTINGARGMDVR